jgi:hypothetical protein
MKKPDLQALLNSKGVTKGLTGKKREELVDLCLKKGIAAVVESSPVGDTIIAGAGAKH